MSPAILKGEGSCHPGGQKAPREKQTVASLEEPVAGKRYVRHSLFECLHEHTNFCGKINASCCRTSGAEAHTHMTFYEGSQARASHQSFHNFRPSPAREHRKRCRHAYSSQMWPCPKTETLSLRKFPERKCKRTRRMSVQSTSAAVAMQAVADSSGPNRKTP